MGNLYSRSSCVKRAGCSKAAKWSPFFSLKDRKHSTYTTKDGLRNDNVTALVESADGSLWAGTSTGLSQFCVASKCGGKNSRTYVTPPLGRFGAWTLVSDRDSNLWIGNETGALRLARDGFTTYDEADGL